MRTKEEIQQELNKVKEEDQVLEMEARLEANKKKLEEKKFGRSLMGKALKFIKDKV